MLRAARHRLLQWKWLEQAALNSHIDTINYGVWKSRAFSSQANFEFRGIYNPVDVELDDPTTELWNRIVSQRKLKKPVEIIKEWRNEGNNVLTDELLCNITYNLCARTQFKYALAVTDWLKDDNKEPKSEFYKLMRLDVLSRNSPMGRAHEYFDKEISNKSETAYLTLLWGHAFRKDVKHAEDVLEEMKKAKLITSGRAYAHMMKMFIKAGNEEKALEMFKEFEESGIPPSADIYWEVLEHRDTIFSSIPAIQKVEKALPKIVVDRWNRRNLLKINAVLGKSEEVDRVWNEMKGSQNKPEAVAAIYSYGLLGNLEKAEEISREVEETTGGSNDHYLVMLKIYAKHGDIEKALEWRDKMGLNGDFEQAHPLILAYLQKGDVDKAMEVYISYRDKEKYLTHSWVEASVIKLIEEFGKRKDVTRAEEVMERIEKHHTVRMYQSLIKAYKSANQTPNKEKNIQTRMEARGLPTDGAEIKELLQEMSGSYKAKVSEGKAKPAEAEAEKKTEKEKSETKSKATFKVESEAKSETSEASDTRNKSKTKSKGVKVKSKVKPKIPQVPPALSYGNWLEARAKKKAELGTAVWPNWPSKAELRKRNETEAEKKSETKAEKPT